MSDFRFVEQKAKLLFLNEMMDAEEAKDCNIVTQVLKEGSAEHRVLIECEKLATKSALVGFHQSFSVENLTK